MLWSFEGIRRSTPLNDVPFIWYDRLSCPYVVWLVLMSSDVAFSIQALHLDQVFAVLGGVSSDRLTSNSAV